MSFPHVPCNVATILGVPEQLLVKVPAGERVSKFIAAAAATGGGDAESEQRAFRNVTTKQLFGFGDFTTPTLSELRKRVRMLDAEIDAGVRGDRTSFGLDPAGAGAVPLLTESGVDIGELQGTLTTDDAAMVQVASNFNCLENASKSVAPECGLLVDTAAEDHTQGPAAAFGALSAYLYRCHFANGGGQTSARPLNLLSDVGEYFGVPENGKLTLRGDERPIPPTATDGAIDAIADRVRLGLHAACPVIFTRSRARGAPRGVFATREMPEAGDASSPDAFAAAIRAAATSHFPLVDQVFSASINFRSFGQLSKEHLSAHGGDRAAALAALARPLLRAAYEGAYLAAIARERRVLLLTLVGGGVFGNPVPLIVEEIERAHRRWAGHRASRLERVVICLFSHRDETSVKAALTASAARV